MVQGVSGESAGGESGGGKNRPVRDQVRSAALAVSGDGQSASLAQRDAKPFSMVGVSWQKPSSRLVGKVEVRTRAVGAGSWSGWTTLDSDRGAGAQTASRGGTEPAWVGLSDAVEVRIDGKAASKLPQGLRLDMIASGGTGKSKRTSAGNDVDPAAFVAVGTDGTDAPTASDTPTAGATDVITTDPSAAVSDSASEPASQPPSESASPSESATADESPSTSVSPSAVTPTAPPSTVPQPPITPRSGWGADESLSPEAPSYIDGKIKAVVLHHTAQSNDYTCAEAPAIINGIYTYDVTTLGWRDIGYNFVVDKCGTIYEGRKGGVDLPVVGSHAYGVNSQTTGIAVLGTYTDAAPSREAMTSVARLAAWVRAGKLAYREDVLDGIEACPGAIASLYRGDNSGKLLVRLRHG